MIPKPIEQITKADIEALITGQRREVRDLEFKELLPGNNDEAKKEFLADVSSFANAAGGDILYGVTAVEGVAVCANGVKIESIDAETLRLSNLIRDGIEPRINGCGIGYIEGYENGPVFLIRLPKSWSAPHLVSFKNSSRFFTRDNAGKHQMDVGQIRLAFTASEALPERIKRFRDERLGRIYANESPVPLNGQATLVLHLLPVSSFSTDFRLELPGMTQQTTSLKPMYCGGWNVRYNIDGYLQNSYHASSQNDISYTQLFRSGQIEAVWCGIAHSANSYYGIASSLFESEIVDSAVQYIRTLQSLLVPLPIVVAASILHAKGAIMFTKRIAYQSAIPIDRDVVILPDVLLDDYSVDIPTLLKPIFDAVWNAAGFAKSPNYDSNNVWKRSI